MDMFEYVAVLASIIIGLGITQLLQGVARVIQHPGRSETYWVHLLWAYYMFFIAIFWWWWEFRLGLVETWTFGLYLFVLFFALLVYLLCALLFPADLTGYSGYREYFMSRKGWFFGGLAALMVVDLVDTWLKGPEHFASLGAEYWIVALVSVVAFGVAAGTKSPRYHGGLVVLAVLYRTTMALRYFETVG